MDDATRQDKIAGLEAIKNKALEMAQQGNDSQEVKEFVVDARKELAFAVPDEEAFRKAAKAAGKFKVSKKK